MSIVVGGAGGLTVLETEPAPVPAYDPVRRGMSEFDGRLFYEANSDIYRMLSDYNVLPEIWSGYVQVACDLLLQALCADASRSLFDCPIDYQRKYRHIDLEFDLPFVTNPVLIYSNRGDERFPYAQSTQSIEFEAYTSLSTDTGYKELRSTVDEETLLRWSWRMTASQLDAGAYLFVGYRNTGSVGMEDSLLVGIGDGGRVGILQVSDENQINFSESVPVVSVDEEVDIEVTYGGDDTIVTVTVTRVADGVVLLDEFTFGTLYGPSDERFSADSFGLVNLNMANLDFSPYALIPVVGRAVVGQVSLMSYLDPSVEDDIQAIPYLQDEWATPTIEWEDGGLYVLDGTTIKFTEQPPEYLLAEYVSYNKELIRNNFGLPVGWDGDNTDDYHLQVEALHSIYWSGPVEGAVRLGMQALLGLPFAAEAGTVTSVNPVALGEFGEIRILGASGIRAYKYPLSVDPLVAVGDVVEQFEVLTDGVEVQHWKSHPTWFTSFIGSPTPSYADIFAQALNVADPPPQLTSELQKYHTYQVSIDAEAFDFTQVGAVQEFLDNTRPTWKSVLINSLVELLDDVSIDDELTGDLVGSFHDHGGSSLILAPKYGAPIGTAPPYDYQYGQLSPVIRYGMFREVFPDETITVTLVNISGAPQVIQINGVITPVAIGETIIEVID